MAMTTAANPDTVVEIVRIVGSLGLGACVAIILAWRSPQLVHEFLAFIRGLIADFRKAPKRERKSKGKQTSIDPAE